MCRERRVSNLARRNSDTPDVSGREAWRHRIRGWSWRSAFFVWSAEEKLRSSWSRDLVRKSRREGMPFQQH